MRNHLKTFALILLALPLAAFGCGTSELSSAQGAVVIDTRCASDSDCPAGFECEIEVEHGATTSVCKSDDPSATCPPGFEVEIEHGQTTCKPHGGRDDHRQGRGRDDGADDGGQHRREDHGTQARGADDGTDDRGGRGADDGTDDRGGRGADDGTGHH